MAYEGYHFVNNQPEKSEEELQKEQEQKLNDSEYQKELEELYKNNNEEEDSKYSWKDRFN